LFGWSGEDARRHFYLAPTRCNDGIYTLAALTAMRSRHGVRRPIDL